VEHRSAGEFCCARNARSAGENSSEGPVSGPGCAVQVTRQETGTRGPEAGAGTGWNKAGGSFRMPGEARRPAIFFSPCNGEPALPRLIRMATRARKAARCLRAGRLRLPPDRRLTSSGGVWRVQGLGGGSGCVCVPFEKACNCDPMRTVDGALAAFVAGVGACIGLAAIAGRTAGKAKSFRPVVRLLQFLDGETVLCGFGGHGGAFTATRKCGLRRSRSGIP
jgi:hypothetical protein